MAHQPLTTRVADALALLITGTHTVHCFCVGCSVRIRYRNVTPEEAKRLTTFAIDHTRH